MSKFFIERPVFAKVLALVILLIGGSASASANLTIPKRQPLRPSPATQHHGAAVRPSISRQAIPPRPVLRRYLPPPAADVPAAAGTQTAAGRCSAWPVSARTGLTGARADLLHASDPAGNVRRAEQGVVFSWT